MQTELKEIHCNGQKVNFDSYVEKEDVIKAQLEARLNISENINCKC